MQPGGGRLQLSSEAAPAGDGSSPAPPEHALNIPAGPLLHFVYHVPARRQFLAPAPQRADSAQACTSPTENLVAACTRWCALLMSTNFSCHMPESDKCSAGLYGGSGAAPCCSVRGCRH
jgi:hypothetical protein